MTAGAAKAGLNFIGDAQTAGSAHVLVSVFQIAVGKDNASADALD